MLQHTETEGKRIGIEAVSYTHLPDYAGFQLLALNDYSGQGTALVGVLDVFFEEKGYINSAEWRDVYKRQAHSNGLNREKKRNL